MGEQETSVAVVKSAEVIPPPRPDFMPVMEIEQALARREALIQFTRKIMKEGHDFGVIPGTAQKCDRCNGKGELNNGSPCQTCNGTGIIGKPTLLKPGAELLCNFFGLEQEVQTEKIIDWDGSEHHGEPFCFYEHTITLKRNGHVVGVGQGNCSSWESKYRWRQGRRACPECRQETIIASKYGETGWICWAPKGGGCKAKFAPDDPRITGQQIGRVPNPDIHDTFNTILKISYKRALIAATLIATNASALYTQDLEDMAVASTGEEPETVTVGSREAQAEVRDRKIHELRRQEEAAAPPAGPPQTMEAVTETVPPIVLDIWKRMGTKSDAIRRELGGLYAQLAVIVGQHEAERIRQDIYARYAAGDPFAKLKYAQQTIFELYKVIRNLQAPAQLPLNGKTEEFTYAD
jgi:hypothetical protein